LVWQGGLFRKYEKCLLQEKRSNTLNIEIHTHSNQKLVKMGDTDTDKQHAANTERERKQTSKRVREKR
jgi:hypothetical protein